MAPPRPRPALRAKQRSPATPRVRRRRAPAASSSTRRVAARSGSAGRPRPRATTLTRPPPSRPRAASVPRSPLTTSLTVPSPPSTATTSAPPATAWAASSVACPAWPVWSSSTLWAAASLATTRSRWRPLNRLACGLAMSATRNGLARFLVLEEPVAEDGQGTVEEPADVHLGDAEPGGDLGLGHAAEEAEVQDPAFALGEPGDQRAEGGPVLERLQALVLGSDVLADRGGVLAPGGGVQGDDRVGVGGVQALQHLLLGQAGLGGDLGDGGGAADLLGQLGHHLVQRQVELLEPARHPHRPALVAEVPLELADDRGGGVGRELHLALQVEAVDGLQQPDGAHLDQVLQRLPAVAEAAGQVLDQRQVQPDQLLAQGRVAGRDEAPEQVLGVPAVDRSAVERGDAVAGGLRVLAPAGVGHLAHPRPPTLRKLSRSRPSSDCSRTSSVMADRICQAKVSRASGSPRSGASMETSTRSSASIRW